MKVYLGIEVFFDGFEQSETVAKVFGDEVKAMLWKDEFKNDVQEWREYKEMEVESPKEWVALTPEDIAREWGKCEASFALYHFALELEKLCKEQNGF